MICCGIIFGSLISVFYLDSWQLPSCIAMLVFVSSYFKPFSNVLAGFILGIFVTFSHYLISHHLSWEKEVVNKPIKISGVVSKILNRGSYSYITLDVSALDKFHISAFKTVYANLAVVDEAQNLAEGDKITGEGKVRFFRSRKNFDTFDAELYAFRNHIHFKGKITVESITPLDTSWQKNYQGFIFNVFKDYKLGWLYYVLLSGDKSQITPNDKEGFRKLGLSHIMAISGLHIGILFTLGFVFLKAAVFTLPQNILQELNINMGCLIGALVLAGIYVILSGMQVSAQRAWLMAALGVTCYFLGLRLSFVRTVVYALTLIVLFSPFSFLNVGLYFSFSAVVAILWLVSRQRQYNHQTHRIIDKFKLLVMVQVTVFLFLLPWSIFVFQGVSVSGLLINLVMIPFLGIVLFPAIVIQSFVSLISDVQLLSGIDSLLSTSYFLIKQWPFNWFSFGKITFQDLGLSVLCLLMLLHKLTLRYASIPVFILMTRWFIWQPPDWQVDIFDVGHGTAVLVSRDNQALLYDLGANYFGTYSIFENVVMPYMRANQLSLIHTIISHDDGDHAGGLEHLISNGYEQSLNVFHGDEYQQPCVNRSIEFGELTINAMWPKALQNNDNNSSCVVHISDGKHSLLLPGDIESNSEYELLEMYEQMLPSTILLAPHHGSKTSSSIEFVRAVEGEMVVFSRGYHSPWGLPHQEVVTRYEQAGYKTFDTALNGHIQIRVFSNHYEVFLAREAKNLWFLR
ncbi:DNA internalization-related competence protein ComEC/Rec2 [Pseudoalteromonas luteoviolacea]